MVKNAGDCYLSGVLFLHLISIKSKRFYCLLPQPCNCQLVTLGARHVEAIRSLVLVVRGFTDKFFVAFGRCVEHANLTDSHCVKAVLRFACVRTECHLFPNHKYPSRNCRVGIGAASFALPL